ncbi:MAG: thiamine phosphate synthase [Candidatus Omnitrophica bacterium]|nr:thiamine phosphate synthase [Candidatus Omnitrophota bacterium]
MKEIFKIIDANFNRTREGLRVIEEALRFIYKDERVLKEIRNIRHNFSKKILEFFPSEKLKISRDIREDKGKDLNRIEKVDLKKLVETNFLRIEESLRTLEEYSKVVKPEVSIFFHDIRFKIYEIEKYLINRLIRKKIKIPAVYIILNLKEDKENFLKFAENVIKGEPDIIQLRYKGENIKFFLKIAKELKKIIPYEIIYLINDRIDISFLCESDGVHIGKNDFDIEDARKILSDKIIGVSTSGIEDLKNIKGKDIDYIAVGSLFKSKTKPEKKPIGVEILKEMRKYISIPIIGIGGINIENAKKVIESGGDGIAVISVVEDSKRPDEIIKKLKEEVYKGWKKRRKEII